MTQKAMRYSVIRFMPYIQTREFANIGIIATCPKTGYFDYLIENRYSRLSQFFQYFDSHVYRSAVAAFSQELERIKHSLAGMPPEQFRHVLEHLSRPRETIIQTGAVGTCLAEREEQQLQNLFDYYVCHSFAKSQPEKEFTQKIIDLVRTFQLTSPFSEEKLGDNNYHIVLPLVQKRDNSVSKIIKPVYLGQDDHTKIYQKADNWIARFRRLRDFGWIKQDTDILIPYLPAQNANANQNKALQIVLQDFKSQGIQLAHQEDFQAIRGFAG